MLFHSPSRQLLQNLEARLLNQPQKGHFSFILKILQKIQRMGTALIEWHHFEQIILDCHECKIINEMHNDMQGNNIKLDRRHATQML